MCRIDRVKSMNEAEYIPALITGFIGLLGVVIGGIINVIAQRRKAVEDQVWEIRQQCSTLAKSATDYSATMAQFVREVDEDKNKARQALPGTEPSEILRDDEYWARIGGELFQAMNETIALSLQVTANKDHRLAQQATTLRLTLIAAHNEVSPVFTPQEYFPPEHAEKLREEINKEAETLLGMITPRWFEGFLRFRRRKTVEQNFEKERKKDSNAKKEDDKDDSAEISDRSS